MEIMTFFNYFKYIGVISVILSIIITLLIVVMVVAAFSNRKKNKQLPKLKVEAKVVSKRVHYRKHRNTNSLYTSYLATFEVTSGDRMELLVPYNEYGLLIEGDRGVLEFQGTMYLSFGRT